MPVIRQHPIFWAMIGIPVAAVLASFYTFYLAISDSEPELPSQYVSEGSALDADFARAQRAIDAGISLNLDFRQAEKAGIVEARYASTTGVPAPEILRLSLTHTTLSELDRQLTLTHIANSDLYRATGAPLPSGRWLVEVSVDDWRLRGRLESASSVVELGAHDGG